MIQNDISKKIIIALDYDNKESVINLCDQLDPSYCRIKVGKQLFTKFGPSIIDLIHKKNFEVFLDLKFHDIPVTVYKACIEAYKLGVWMLNVHLLGGEEMIKAAKQARDKENPSALIIGVSLLTSHSDGSLEFLGLKNRVNAVKNLAILAEKCSIDGLVCSPSDITTIKGSVSNLIYVTPGIRLNDHNDDHAKIYTPKKALSLGSDYLVIGRPITEAKEPMDVVKKIISTN
jgi:orotidine-5'-phosphate decarboxylase